MSAALDEQLERAAGALRRASRAMAFTGAGISVASGIPDFRSPGGLWSRYNPDEVATLQALRTNPRGVWEFLLEAKDVFGRAEPNPAHKALARLSECGLLGEIVTQNIDGLHQAAGSPEVIEYHGGLRRFRCMSCAREHPLEEAAGLTLETIPWRCSCGGVVRPDIVFFGEGIPPDAARAADEAVAAADFCLVVGASGEVQPAGLIPSRIKAKGGVVVEVNLGPTSYDRVSDIRLDAPAQEVLPRLAELAC